jgi:hypothetical protein
MLDHEGELVDGDDGDRLACRGAAVTPRSPDLTGYSHLAVRRARRDDGCAPADERVDSDLPALAADSPVPEEKLADEEREAQKEPDHVPRVRKHDEQHHGQDEKHRSMVCRCAGTRRLGQPPDAAGTCIWRGLARLALEAEPELRICESARLGFDATTSSRR